MRSLFRLVGFLLLVALVLGGLAFWFASQYVDVDVDIESGRAVVTVTLEEDDINRIVRYSLVEGGPSQSVLEDITRLDVRDGLLRVEGAYTAPDGSRKLGWVDLSMEARDGHLVVQVADLDREGIAKGGETLARINERLASQMAKDGPGSDRHARVTDVTIGNDKVVLRAVAE